MSVLALIPARSGSKGIANKNFKVLGKRSLVAHAADVAREARCEQIVITSDMLVNQQIEWGCGANRMRYIHRPAQLAQDDTPMIDVIKHALAEISGPPDQVIVLLQCTQPFRKPTHIQQAIALLRETQADSVVSVVPLPLTHSPEFALRIRTSGELGLCNADYGSDLMDLPSSRQDVKRAYIRDGTVYAFWRRTVTTWGSIYGYRSVALPIDPADSCELDTEADWHAVEARWRARQA